MLALVEGEAAARPKVAARWAFGAPAVNSNSELSSALSERELSL